MLLCGAGVAFIKKRKSLTYNEPNSRVIYKFPKKISEKLLKEILNVYGYTSARVVIREDIESEQLVDFINGNKTYAKGTLIVNANTPRAPTGPERIF